MEDDLFSACLRDVRAIEHDSAVSARDRVLNSRLDDLTLPITRKEYLPHLELLGREWIARLEQPEVEEDSAALAEQSKLSLAYEKAADEAAMSSQQAAMSSQQAAMPSQQAAMPSQQAAMPSQPVPPEFAEEAASEEAAAEDAAAEQPTAEEAAAQPPAAQPPAAQQPAAEEAVANDASASRSTDIGALLASVDCADMAFHVRHIALLDELYDRTNSWALGAGANGAVSTLVKRGTGVTYALKTMPPDLELHGGDGTAALASLMRDVRLQRGLSHPNIAPVLDIFVDPDSHEVSFVMGLATGGSLNRFLAAHAGLSEADRARIVLKMLRAVRYCHEEHVVHRDIKLDNFVFSSEAADAEPLLIDFGMAAAAGPSELLSNGCSTLRFMAPEMFPQWHMHVLKTGDEVLYDHKVDVWALGLVVYQMLTGRMPFGLGDDPAEDEDDTIDRIVHESVESLTFPEDADAVGGVSEAAGAFCARLLTRDAEARPTAEEALEDPWMLEAAEAGDSPTGLDEGTLATPGLVEALKAFPRVSALQRASLRAMANHVSAAADGVHVKAVRQAFMAMDSDSSGTVNKSEFVEVLASVPATAEVDAADLFDSLDACTGGKGALEWRWFLAATLAAPPVKSKTAKVGGAGMSTHPPAPHAQAQPGLMDAFLELDRDCDGVIDARDVESALHDAGSDLDEEAIRALLVQAGHGASSLTFDDFSVLMLNGAGHEVAAAISTSLNKATRASERWRRATGQVAAVAALARK